MPQINTDVWGENFGIYKDYINKRSGASAITDPDYTSFPPFCFISSDMAVSGIPFTSAMSTLYEGGNIELNSPLDESICYVGMYNSDLPQCNIGVFFAGDTQNDPTFKTDNTQIQSFFLYSSISAFALKPVSLSNVVSS